MTNFIVTPYSRFQLKKTLKEAMNTESGFAEAPAIDLYKPPEMLACSPNEIKEVLGLREFAITNMKRSWIGNFAWDETKEKWKFT